jgi:hypothetical protein
LIAPTAHKDSLPVSIKFTWPKDTLVSRLRASLQFCRRAFALEADSKLADNVALGPSSCESIPRLRALLFFTTDLAEHYGQVASYMRLMGLVPPSALRRPDH